jgi:hypothetical protein
MRADHDERSVGRAEARDHVTEALALDRDGLRRDRPRAGLS